MRTTIDAAGRLIVPKTLRDELGLTAGSELEIRAGDGALIVEPIPTPVALVHRGNTIFAEPEPETHLPELASDDVRDALEGTRR